MIIATFLAVVIYVLGIIGAYIATGATLKGSDRKSVFITLGLALGWPLIMPTLGLVVIFLSVLKNLER